MYKKLIHADLEDLYEEFGKSRSAEEILNLAGPHFLSLDKKLRNQARLFAAICLFKEKNFEKCLYLLEEIHNDGYEDKETYGILATTLVFLDRPGESEPFIDKALTLEKETFGYLTLDLYFAYTNALAQKKEAALFWKQIDLFHHFFSNSSITDTTWLAIREIPPFEAIIDDIVTVLKHEFKPDEFAKWKALSQTIDEEGKMYLQKAFSQFEKVKD